MQRLHYKHVDALVDKETGLFRKFLSEEMIQPEQWKDVPGYEGYYQVSDKGRVRSLDRVTTSPKNFTRRTKGRLMKWTTGKGGALYMALQKYKNTEVVVFSPFKLIAVAFLGEMPYDCNNAEPVDGDYLNICLENTKWKQSSLVTDTKLNIKLGVELLSIKDKEVRYKFVGCGHEQNYKFKLSHNTKEAVCKTCVEDNIANQLDQLGCKYNGRTKEDSQLLNVVFKECGHTKTIHKAMLNEPRLVCNVCIESEWTRDAKKHGLTFIKHSSPTKAVYQFDDCLHSQEMYIQAAKRGSFRCNNCRFERYKEEAKAEGIEYLNLTSKGKALYKLPCGCKKILDIASVRYGRWYCQDHEERHWEAPSNLYVFSMSSGNKSWLKFGYSNNTYLRFKSYFSEESREKVQSSLLIKVPVETARLAVRLEKSLHKKYKLYNLDHKEMKNYLTESGYTECYDIQIQEELLNDLKEIEIATRTKDSSTS